MEKIALVTGSSRGIGRAVARQLAHQGWKVCINYRVRQDCAESLAAELTAEGLAAMTCQADVSQREQVQAMARAVERNWGPVSLLVNNAGVAGQSLFQDVTDEMWHRYFSTNVDGAYHAIQAVLPAMLYAHEGCIINISSMGAFGPLTKISGYSAAKAGVSNYTQWLATYLARSGVRVNAIAPGFFRTEQNRALQFNPDGTPTPRVKKILAGTPMGRYGELSELIGALLFLVDERAAGFVTGVVLPVDGGYSAYSGV